jgi:hypothetical protein
MIRHRAVFDERASIAPCTSRAAAAIASSARTSPAFMPSARASAHNLSISPSVSDRRWRAFAASDAMSPVGEDGVEGEFGRVHRAIAISRSARLRPACWRS